jgi:hypothetical protein
MQVGSDDMEWQAIETAPKDGIWVLLYENNFWHVCAWCELSKSWEDKESFMSSLFNPTHWSPLRKPINKQGE